MPVITLEQKRLIIRITTVLGIMLTIVGSIFIGNSEFFQPSGAFEQWLRSLGWLGPLFFIIIQITQVIYPIIPFGLTNVIGDVLFGTGWGFVFNCTGMLIGSCINFYLGRTLGEGFVKAFISDAQYERYIGKMNEGQSFVNLLRLGFILPIFPDDIFCIIAGMSNLQFGQFFRILVVFRPISLFVYTFFSSKFIQYLFSILF